MKTLPDAHTIIEDESPHKTGPAAGLLSGSETQEGASSDYVPPAPDPQNAKCWYVLRATYDRGRRLNEELTATGITSYYPLQNIIKKQDGRKIPLVRPLIPNLVFVHTDRATIDTFLSARHYGERYIKYLLDRTRPVEWNGKHPPVTIDNRAMDAFRKICDTQNENIRFLSLDQAREIKQGDTVLVTEGDFRGIEGRYVRALGQWRVAVEIGTFGFISTAYIPKSFVRVVKKS